MIGTRRIKMRYAHLGGSNPPLIIIHGNQVDKVPDDYRRYLENVFRKVFKMAGTPIRIEFKSGENPFAEKAIKPSEREAVRNKRLVETFKKRARRG
jgi:GTP-binding protein